MMMYPTTHFSAGHSETNFIFPKEPDIEPPMGTLREVDYDMSPLAWFEIDIATGERLDFCEVR